MYFCVYICLCVSVNAFVDHFEVDVYQKWCTFKGFCDPIPLNFVPFSALPCAAKQGMPPSPATWIGVSNPSGLVQVSTKALDYSGVGGVLP